MGSELFALLLITLLAVLVPVLSNRMKWVYLPIVVGEIFAGMIIGKSGLNLVEPTPALNFRAESGISFLLTVVMAATIGLSLAGLGITRNGILIGLILSTTSLGIVVPVLKERGLTTSNYGRILPVSALIGDFVTLLLLSLVIALVSRGASMDLMLFMLLLAAFAAAVQIELRVKGIRLVSKTIEERSHATAQIRVRGALALMVGWVFLSRVLGVEVILGAFLAGAFISLVTGGRESILREKLDAIG